MLKFLRKYDKWILAIGGSLLMVAFLLPQALQQLGSGGMNMVVATYTGGEITREERFAANSRLQFLSSALAPVVNAFEIEDQDHWLMLAEEARAAGLVGGPETGRTFFDGIVRQYMGADPDEFFPLLLLRSGQTEAYALDSFAELAGISLLHSLYLQSQRVSMPELLQDHYEQSPTVGLHAGVVSADALLDTITKFPIDEDLQAFFDEHKETQRAGGRLDFGYRVEDAVKFEWIDLAPEHFGGAIVLDPVEVNARWRRMREIYTGEFVEERERVEEDMRRETTARIFRDAETVVLSASSRAERDGTLIDLPGLAEAIRTTVLERSGVALPQIAYDKRDEKWNTRTDLQATPRVRNARLQSGSGETFPEIALNVRELNPDDPTATAVGDIIGPLRSTSGSLIYARVIEARPAGAPESLESVREQVVEDWRLQQAWNELLERSQRFPDQVAVRGLPRVIIEAGGEFVDGLRAEPGRLRQPITRTVDAAIFSRVNDPAFAAAIFERARTIEPIGDVRDFPIEERIVVAPLPSDAAVAVAQIIAVDPISESSFESAVETLLSTIQSQRLFRNETPYTFERIKERLAYERIGGRDEEEDEALAELDDAS